MKRNWNAVAIFLASALLSAPVFAQNRDDEQLLRARETVWRAWFAGDTKTLEELVPPETIVMSGGEEKWKNQADILRTSSAFHARGGKLLRLEFPRTEVAFQVARQAVLRAPGGLWLVPLRSARRQLTFCVSTAEVLAESSTLPGIRQ